MKGTFHSPEAKQRSGVRGRPLQHKDSLALSPGIPACSEYLFLLLFAAAPGLPWGSRGHPETRRGHDTGWPEGMCRPLARVVVWGWPWGSTLVGLPGRESVSLLTRLAAGKSTHGRAYLGAANWERARLSPGS